MQQQQHTTKTFQQRRNQPVHGDNRGTGRHCHQKRCQCRHSSQNYSQTVFWWMVYLVFVQDSSKKWKELPKQLNRNTADVEWRAGGDGVDRSRKMGNGQTASLRAKWCFSCYFAFRYIECTLNTFMMWIWFYKTIDIPVGGFQNLRTKYRFSILHDTNFPGFGKSRVASKLPGNSLDLVKMLQSEWPDLMIVVVFAVKRYFTT